MNLALHAQVGGKYINSSFDLATSARIAALGSNFITVNDGDINVGITNPSFISPAMHQKFAFNFTNYYTVNYGTAAYSHTFDKFGSYVATLQYVNYGREPYTDENGNESGTFGASDYMLGLGWAKPIVDSMFFIGANFKNIFSNIDVYRSWSVAVDVAAGYTSPNKLFSASLMFRNIGFQIVKFHDSRELVPFQIDAGLSQKLAHAPFRLSLLLQHLERWDMQTEDAQRKEIDPTTGETKEKSNFTNFADNAMRHVVIGIEFIPVKRFYFDVGFNYNRRQDLMEESTPSTVGISWGFGLNFSKFQIGYARAKYHLSGSPNYITFQTKF